MTFFIVALVISIAVALYVVKNIFLLKIYW